MMLGMMDTVRTRVLTFVLEIQSELPEDVETPTQAIPPEKVEQMVQIHIYGGNNNIGDNGVIHANTVIAGDLASLKTALAGLGLSSADAEELKAAVEADAKDDKKKEGLGKRSLAWVGKTALAGGAAGLKIGGEVAKATLTALAMKYAGIPPSS